jgi:hypothetical protein
MKRINQARNQHEAVSKQMHQLHASFLFLLFFDPAGGDMLLQITG